MAFRYDMQGKTPQQQAIVAQRDAEDKRRQQEAAKQQEKRKRSHDANTEFLMLVIDKDKCPGFPGYPLIRN